MPVFLMTALMQWRSITKVVVVVVGVFTLIVMLVQLLVLSLLQKSMFSWPVAAPLSGNTSEPAYLATGWTVSSPFGWRPSLDTAGSYELHEGIDLVGDMFCLGCALPPVLDSRVARNGVRWDQEDADDPMTAGSGVVVEFEIQHPEESGMLGGEKTYGLYGHLQPYRVHVRRQSCVQEVSCPIYGNTDAGSVRVTCPGRVVQTGRGRGETAYAYATPGDCTATVSWPSDWTPDGPSVVHFDQQIDPGAASADAAISFRAQEPPPPTPTPTLEPLVP